MIARAARIVLLALLTLLASARAHAQGFGPADGAPVPAASPLDLGSALGGAGADPFNPAAILAGAAQAIPGLSSSGQGGGGGVTPDNASNPAAKQGLSPAMNMVLVLTVITLVPSIMLMMTCFLRIVIVLGLLKQALGTQQMPPSQVLLGLSLILTMLVMSPTLDRLNKEVIQPQQRGQLKSYQDLWGAAQQPLRDFMFDQIEATGNYSSLYMILRYRGVDVSDPSKLTRANVDMISLTPAFVLSELKVAFLMGFRIYLPFLVIDLVISAILIAMNMMMLPPVLISLPFKLLLFVLVDGWNLVVGTLLTSFSRPGNNVSLAGTGPPGEGTHAVLSALAGDVQQTLAMLHLQDWAPLLGLAT